jgi:hydroxyacyl-ACP dehydratase HTD2-like protein with hotdog domain
MTGIIERSELLLPGPAQALGALLGVRVPDLADTPGLPLLWHWVYLLDRPAQADLGLDGHALRGTLPTLLFRFSALTYNAHRIHYDRDYARDAEGYPGLLTHGPLQALAMAEAIRAAGCGGHQHFEYRLTAPLFDHQGMIVSLAKQPDAMVTAVRDRYGRQTATGVLRRMS